MNLLKRLDEIKARCEKATEGPWTTYSRSWDVSWPENSAQVRHSATIEHPSGALMLHSALWPAQEVDREFICHARTDVPELEEALREAYEVLKSVSGAVPVRMVDEWLEKYGGDADVSPKV